MGKNFIDQKLIDNARSAADQLIDDSLVQQNNPNENLLAKKQTSILEKKIPSKEVNEQDSKLAKKQTSLPVKKFGSYLPKKLISQLKIYAIKHDMEVYEVLQEAVEKHIL